MVFAINCGPDGAANSFTNFKNAALQIGDELKAAASSASSAPPSSTSSAPPSGITIPPAPEESVVTVTVTVDASTWTTTYSSYPGSAAPTPASLEGRVWTVKVGNNGTLTYDPPTIQAAPRDIISFELYVSISSRLIFS